jgi:cyclohexa-1,5-dienecarbonyl-CoA hydratase
MFRDSAASAVFVLAAVRGQCLGGGLELAAFAHRLVAAPGAALGQPEIRLGVIAPAASVILPQRMGRPGAEDLCVSGRVLSAEEAHAAGLVDEVAEDPTEAAFAYVREHLLPHSASSLRYAVRAVRLDFDRRLREDLAAVERLYLEELCATHDGVEGIEAFLGKRRPAWTNE